MTVLRESTLTEETTLNSDGNKAIRVVVTSPGSGEDAGPANLLLNGLTEINAIGDQPSLLELGTFTVTSGSGSITYSIISDPSSAFQVIGNKLFTSRPLDPNSEPLLNVTVQATDQNNKFTETLFTINVLDAGGFLNKRSYSLLESSYMLFEQPLLTGRLDKSIAMWVKFEQTGVDQTLFNSKFGTNEAGIQVVILSTAASNDIQIIAEQTNGQTKNYRYNFPANFEFYKWHLFVFHVEFGAIRFWLDGVTIPTTIQVNQDFPSFDSNDSQILRIGSTNFVGLIDEIYFFDFALSNAQNILLYNNGISLDPVGSLGFVATDAFRAEEDVIPVVENTISDRNGVMVNATFSQDTPVEFQNNWAFRSSGLGNYFLGNGKPDFSLAKSFEFIIKRETTGVWFLYGNGANIDSDDSYRIYFSNNTTQQILFEIEGQLNTSLRKQWVLGSGITNNWSHIVITMPANNLDANNVNLYLDGELVAGGVQQNNLAAIPNFTDTISFGASNTGVWNGTGSIDEFYIWNKELTLAEADEGYNEGFVLNPNERTYAATLNQEWRFGDKNDRGAVMFDQKSAKSVTMINYDISYYVEGSW